MLLFELGAATNGELLVSAIAGGILVIPTGIAPLLVGAIAQPGICAAFGTSAATCLCKLGPAPGRV